MNEDDVIEIHNKLHDTHCSEISWGTKKFPIKYDAKKKARKCEIMGHKFMTQNLEKDSEWCEKAKNGWKVTWLISTNPWGRIVTPPGSTPRIDQYCSAFPKDQTSTVSLKNLITTGNLNSSIPQISNSTTGTTNTSGKPACHFGKECYRKNPEHIRDFWHPPKTNDNNNNNNTLNKSNSSLKNSGASSSSESEQPATKKQKTLHLEKENGQENLKNSSNSANSGLSTPKTSITLTPAASILDFSELKFDDITLGQGAFGAVKKGRFRNSVVAIKTLLSGTNDQQTIESFKKEADILCKLRHVNIVLCMGVTIPKETSELRISEYCLVMEYLPQDLRKYLRDTGGLLTSIEKISRPIMDLNNFLNISKGIAFGMCYLHGATPKIIHRDLKPANILLDSNLVPKIADFGVSREKQETSQMTRIGTPHYCAPEVLQGKKYNEKVDVYSYGMILYQMVTGKVPFSGMGNENEELNAFQVIMKASIENIRPPLPLNCPTLFKSLIEMCWDKDPEERPKFDLVITCLEELQKSPSDLKSLIENDHPQATESTLPMDESTLTVK